MSWLESDLPDLIIPIGIGLLWSIQTCLIGYVLIFCLLHECYITSRMKLFGIATTGIITGTSHQHTAEYGDEHFVHYEFSTNPPYPRPTWNAKAKVTQLHYSQCKKGEIVRIIFDSITRNSDFYYEGYRSNMCTKCSTFCFCFMIPFPITSISTALYYSFHYDPISGIVCIAFGLIISIPACIYLCKRRHTFCFRYKFKDSEDIGISKHQTVQDIRDTMNRNHRAHSSLDVDDIINDTQLQNMIMKAQMDDIKEESTHINVDDDEEEALKREMDEDDDEKVQEIPQQHPNKLVRVDTDTPPNTVSGGPMEYPLRSELKAMNLTDGKIHVRNTHKRHKKQDIHVRNGSTGIVINKYKRREYIQNVKERKRKTKKKQMDDSKDDAPRSSIYLRDDLDEGYYSESKEDDGYKEIKRKKRIRHRSQNVLKKTNSKSKKRKHIEYDTPITHYKSVSLNNNNPFIDDGVSIARLRKIKWNTERDKRDTEYDNGKEGKKAHGADNEETTMTLTMTQTVTMTSEQSPNISPYIVDDGTESFTADTFEIYKDTSVKSMFKKNDNKHINKKVQNKSKTSKTSSNRLNGRVITPIPMKYLTGTNAIHRHIYHKNINIQNRIRKINIENNRTNRSAIYKNKKDKDNDILYQSVNADIKTASV